ncbi:hypothetical protein FISHEDRAFT_75801 [Fistulina hepatica ATCC 64428]|uniref:Uncharacterized protein n=1 Tax=Fistulina hepatica ATCC 64428 TaxID=1128425 RepID=A0A0D7A6A0_9AGAR|nr:hypothetical protein FISHEDRAFT_75801 [Fistulina hepatica ATCC 64428]
MNHYITVFDDDVSPHPYTDVHVISFVFSDRVTVRDLEGRRHNCRFLASALSLMDVDDYRPSFSFEGEVVRIEYTNREQPLLL